MEKNKKEVIEKDIPDINGINMKRVCEMADVPYQKVFDAKRFGTSKNLNDDEKLSLHCALERSSTSFKAFLKS